MYCPNSAAFLGCGTVFSLDPTTGTETVLYSFCNQTICTDGLQPDGSLIDVKGRLYGTTQQGGSNANCGYGGEGGCGTVFVIDLGTRKETVLYSFCSQANCADGQFPLANLIAVNGALYGTTELGGPNCEGTGECGGTVFAITNP